MAALHRPALPAPRAFLKRRQGRLIAAAAGVVIVAAAAFQVNQFSTATSASYDINELSRLRAARQAENRDLEAEVAGLSSLARVDLEARLRLGLVPAERKLYVDVNQPLPQKQTLPTRFLPPDAHDTVPAPDPLWKRLLRLLPFF
jgi:cell division protein FtsB